MITVEVKDQEVTAMLRRLMDGMKDMRPAMANVAQALARESERQLAGQTGPLGGWPALANSTIERRARKGTWPGRMLQVSPGGLAASIQTGFGTDWARIGSNKPYSAIHMFGGAAGRAHAAKIPARPYLPFNPQTAELSEPAKATVLDVLETFLGQLSR